MSEELTDAIARVMALSTVTAQIIEVLIATHPDPKALHHAWQRELPSSVDGEMDTPPFGVEAYREAYVGNMEGLSRLIARRAAD